MYEGRVTPDEVWDCIAHFPRNSATWSAAFDDPEFEVSDEPGEMKLAEFSPEAELLADLYDLTASLVAHVSAFTSKRPVKVPPHRRPGEARRKAMEERRRAQARREWSELLKKLGIPE
jgi:hypothetical protein